MIPTVSVLMTVYNAEMFVRKAIQSILSQTYKDFEFIIINDGSIDNSKNTILSFDDKRIRYIENERNIGLTKSLNIGVRISVGKYIARMDADDISLPHRLERQVEFMESNKSIGLCGSWVRCFGSEKKIVKYEKNHDDIVLSLFRGVGFAHPAVMFKRSVLTTNYIQYDEQASVAQDFILWHELKKYTKFANLPEVLLKYRVHCKSITQTKRNNQLKIVEIIVRNEFRSILGRELRRNELDLFMGTDIKNIPLYSFKEFCEKLNANLHIEKKIRLLSFIGDRLLKYCIYHNIVPPFWMYRYLIMFVLFNPKRIFHVIGKYLRKTVN